MYSLPKEATALLLYWRPAPSDQFSSYRLGEEAFRARVTRQGMRYPAGHGSPRDRAETNPCPQFMRQLATSTDEERRHLRREGE